MPLGLVIGTLLAVVAHRRLRGIKVFQTIFSSTIASSVAVTAVVFYTSGQPRDRGTSSTCRGSTYNQPPRCRGVALSLAWQCIGLSFVIVLAGLQTVPEELMEAATLDGYGAVRRFFRVTMPLISPTLLFLTVVLAVAFQVYAEIEILTQGGPAGTPRASCTRSPQPDSHRGEQRIDHGARASSS